METFTLTELIVLALFTAYLVYEYSAKSVPMYIKIIIFITWYTNFVTLTLIPLDVYLTKTNDDNNQPQQTNSMVSIWRLIYWTSFALSWLILPILQEYVDSGEFSPKQKLIRSLKVNLTFYLVCIGLGIAGVVYLKLSGSWTNTSEIATSVVMLATAFGILLIILLLGYGLVMIPKRCFQSTSKELNLKYFEFQAAAIEDQKNNLTIELEDLIKMVLIIIQMNDTETELRALCKKIIDSCPDEFVSVAKRSIGSYGRNIFLDEIGTVNMAKIISLNQKIKHKLHELNRVEHRWNIIIDKALFLEDIIESTRIGDRIIRTITTSNKNTNSAINYCLERIKWIWYVKIQSFILMFFGVVSVIFSVIIVFGELFIFINSNINIIGYFVNNNLGYIEAQLICFVPLFYLATCTYFALFNVNLPGLYGLYSHHQTDSGSLVFAGMNFSRISCPLAYNFLQMINTNDTAFMNFMGLEQISISKAYQYFPWILVLLIIFNVFDCYGKILSSLGLTQFKFSDTFTDERIDDGKKILQRARGIRSRDFQRLEDTNYPIDQARVKLNPIDYESTGSSQLDSAGMKKIIVGSNSTKSRIKGVKCKQNSHSNYVLLNQFSF